MPGTFAYLIYEWILKSVSVIIELVQISIVIYCVSDPEGYWTYYQWDLKLAHQLKLCCWCIEFLISCKKGGGRGEYISVQIFMSEYAVGVHLNMRDG